MHPTTINLPDEAGIFELASPGFEASPPCVVNRHLIPPAILASMEWAWNTPRFPERPVRVVRLHDVWVAKEGLVFDRDGNLYRETVTQHSEAEVDQAHAAVLAAMERGGEDAEPDRNGPILLCKKRGIGNYGHWMMEMLPKARFVERHLPELKARFLVAHAPAALSASMAASLSLMGIDLTRTLVADDTPWRFSDLLLVDGLSDHGAFLSPLVLDSIDAVSRVIEPAGADRLFVTRRAMGFRRVVDEDTLITHARDHGYTLVDPGTLPLREQIALFKGASRIVGVMGAAMTNIAFAPAGARILTLTPAGMPDTFFWFIATLRGLDYTEIRCAQSGPVRGNMLWDTDLVLPRDSWDPIFAG